MIFLCVGTALSFQAVTRQVFLTLMSLTSVFGMGTGGSSSPLAPTIEFVQTRFIQKPKVFVRFAFMRSYVPSKLNNEKLALATLGQALDRLVLPS